MPSAFRPTRRAIHSSCHLSLFVFAIIFTQRSWKSVLRFRRDSSQRSPRCRTTAVVASRGLSCGERGGWGRDSTFEDRPSVPSGFPDGRAVSFHPYADTVSSSKDGFMRPGSGAKNPEESISSRLVSRIGRHKYNMWFDQTARLEIDGSNVRVSTSNQIVADWIGSHFSGDLQHVAEEMLGAAAGGSRGETGCVRRRSRDGRCKFVDARQNRWVDRPEWERASPFRHPTRRSQSKLVATIRRLRRRRQQSTRARGRDANR